MPSKKRKFGDIGEAVAEKYLKKESYKILERNFNTKLGEIDIVTQKDNELIFVEVKTSNYKSQIAPEENFTQDKIRKFLRAVEIYLISNEIPETTSYRLDLIAISLNQDTKRAGIKHFENILE